MIHFRVPVHYFAIGQDTIGQNMKRPTNFFYIFVTISLLQISQSSSVFYGYFLNKFLSETAATLTQRRFFPMVQTVIKSVFIFQIWASENGVELLFLNDFKHE